MMKTFKILKVLSQFLKMHTHVPIFCAVAYTFNFPSAWL